MKSFFNKYSIDNHKRRDDFKSLLSKRFYNCIKEKEEKEVSTSSEIEKHKHKKDRYCLIMPIQTWVKNGYRPHGFAPEFNGFYNSLPHYYRSGKRPQMIDFINGKAIYYLNTHITWLFHWVHFTSIAPKVFDLKDVWGIIIEYYQDQKKLFKNENERTIKESV